MIILLTIPACIIAWRRGGWTARLAVAITTAGFLIAGDISWTFLLPLVHSLVVTFRGLPAIVPIALQTFPVPLILLSMTVFYLWLYARWADSGAAIEQLEENQG